VTPAQVTSLREAFGLSLQEFARALHVHTFTAQRWEAGDHPPKGLSLAMLRALETVRGRTKEPRSLGHALTLGVASLVVAALSSEPVELLARARRRAS
jgi:transcriptional regulator with XRE-family HTH domain